MRVYILGSGSSGNVLVVEADGARVMIDAGLNPTQTAARMSQLGAELLPRAVDAIIVTHHHGDHIGYAEPLARATRAPLYFHDGIEASRVRARATVTRYAAGAPFRVGELEVLACAIPHDAPQMALRIASRAAAFVIATDLGHVPPALVAMLRDADAALVEANHCTELLAVGPYPEHLKRRVGGAFGHLSNHQTAVLAGALVGSRLRALYLGHVSEANNTPDRAFAAVAPRCPGIDVTVIAQGTSHVVDVVARRPSGALQLDLAFA